jgi:hypothetical protein
VIPRTRSGPAGGPGGWAGLNFLTILPLAVVMVAGTQLVAAVLLASADRHGWVVSEVVMGSSRW